jgi:hypothetical protein
MSPYYVIDQGWKNRTSECPHGDGGHHPNVWYLIFTSASSISDRCSSLVSRRRRENSSWHLAHSPEKKPVQNFKKKNQDYKIKAFH